MLLLKLFPLLEQLVIGHLLFRSGVVGRLYYYLIVIAVFTSIIIRIYLVLLFLVREFLTFLLPIVFFFLD